MNHPAELNRSRLAKVGISAVAVPTLLVGLVALGGGNNPFATGTGSELIKHENPVNGGKNKDVDKKEDKKASEFDNPANEGENKDDVDEKESSLLIL